MHSAELVQLEKSLGFSLKVMAIDWEKFKQDYGFTYTNEADEAADRRYFNWHHFRGVHDPQSCLLDEEGHVRGIILRGTADMSELELPPLPALEYLCVCDNENLEEVNFKHTYPLLQHVDLSRNHLVTFSLDTPQPLLKNLNLLGNILKRVNINVELPALEELDVSQNEIKNWPIRTMDKLPAILFLYMNSNPLNESLSAYWRKEDGGNYARCLKELRESFGDVEPKENNEYKVLVIGDGKAGKSCMVKRLVDNEFEREWDSTHGISIRQYSPDENEKRWTFNHILNMWDFGGQDIYHATHRLFMQRNTIYILLWNRETEFNPYVEQPTKKRTYKWENKKVAYWLAYAQYLGDNSPIIVAQTHSSPLSRKPAHPKEDSLIRIYKDNLPYMSDFLDIDASIQSPRDSGYKMLIRAIEDSIDSLEREEFLPAHWLTIRTELEKRRPPETADSLHAFMAIDVNTLDYDVYEKIAIDAGEKNPALLLENWLVQTGVVFYRKGLFDNKLILNQAWAIRAVYALYDRSEDGYYNDIKENRGRFDGELLNRCWSDYGQQEREWFIDFMLKAELCFEITQDSNTSWEKRTFVAIEMLSPERCSAIRVQEKNWEDKLVYELRYRYPFLHTGIIQRFIARSHGFVTSVDDIYKNGLLVSVDNQLVIIEAHQDQDAQSGYILVRTAAAGIRALLRVQKEFEELQQDKKIDQAVRPADGEWVALDVLQNNRGASTVPVYDGSKSVAISPYLPFLHDAEQVIKLSDDTRAGRPSAVSPAQDSPAVIEVFQKEDARIKHKAIAGINPLHILFTAATPQHAGQINVGYETRFKDLIREFDRKDKIQFKEEQGLSQERFRNYLFTDDPHIFHFAGHGETEGLVLQDRSLDASVLLNLVKLQHNTQVVLLNACNSLPMAKELAGYIPYVIGTPGPLSDDAAISFARGFYTGIASGRTVEDSYWYAVNSIEADGHGGGYLPVLVKRTSSTVGKTGSTAASVAVEVTSNPVVPPTTPNPTATTPKKVFLSYARPLLNEAEKLRTHLAVQRRNGKIEFWYDQAIVVGDTWDEAIKAKIEEADIFILLLSADFWASDYIHERELPLIEQRHRAGAKVMCVMVSANDFEETNWSRLQASPRLQGRLTPIQNWNNIDDAWQAVVGDLRKLIS